MKRSEFLLRLAVENKLAVVSEEVDVIQLHNSEPVTSEEYSSPVCTSPRFDWKNVQETSGQVAFISQNTQNQYHDIVIEENQRCTSSVSFLMNSLEKPSTLHNGEVTPEINVENLLNNIQPSTCQEVCSAEYKIQEIEKVIPEKFSSSETNANSKYKVHIIQNIIIPEKSVPEMTSPVESFSANEDFIDGGNMPSYLPQSNTEDNEAGTREITFFNRFFPKLIKSADSPYTRLDKTTDSDERPDTLPSYYNTDLEKNNYSDSESFQDYKSSGSEYAPSDDSIISSSSVYQSSSDHGTDKEKKSSGDNGLRYSACSKIGEVKTTYSRKNSNLPISTESDKHILYDISNNMEICDNIDNQPSTSKIDQQYVKKSCARERPTICPICYQDVITHFTRHLFRHHGNNKDVKLIKSLKPGNKDRLALVAALRKQGYIHLNTEKNILNPVRSSKNPISEYSVCIFCLGHYTKKLLYKHVKHCRNKPADVFNPGRHCLSESQTLMASMLSKNQEFLRTSRIKNEVFGIMRADNISAVAKTDPLICLYGETLLAKHKRQQIANVVSNKIREMARMLIVLRSMHGDIRGMFDVLKPEMFSTLISAAKVVSGYNENAKTFKAPSLALHLGTNLKLLCNVGFKIVLEKKNLPNITWENKEQKKGEIKDLIKLIEGHWCNEISSIALKTLKERQWEKPVQLPLTSDILAFQTYVNDLAERAYERINVDNNDRKHYKLLPECVLAQTVMFNRKRVGDVQYLKMEYYSMDNCRNDQEAFTESLTVVEKIISKKFKRVVTGGKGSKPVPILFRRRIQKYITCLLKVRTTTDIVPNTNPYLFANPGSDNKWMAGANIIRRLAQNCGAKQPSLLTSTKFRKHIATTLQLMNMQPDEMEQVATFMGHTKKTHAEFYRLPQDIYQTAKVVKVLLLLEKGKGKEFKGKSLNEIELDTDIYYSSESEEDENDTKPLSEIVLRRAINTSQRVGDEILRNECVLEDKENHVEESTQWMQERKELPSKGFSRKQLSEDIDVPKDKSSRNKTSGRFRWSNREKKLVLDYFGLHVKNKITPKKHECEQFLEKHRNILENKDWVKVKTLVYNSFRLNYILPLP